MNVTFTIPRDEDIVFAIEARDWADEVTGLEYDNRCVGDGGLRMMFSNGVVSNSSWVCTGVHYGPENWKTCFGAQRVRKPDTPTVTGLQGVLNTSACWMPVSNYSQARRLESNRI